MKLLIIALVVCLSAFAASIDGKYTTEFQMPAGKRGAGRTVEMTIELKSEGSALKGKVTAKAGRRDRSSQVLDGKVDGDKFSFTTKQNEHTIRWEGTVSEDELKGTRTREDGGRAVPFTAKRKS